MVDGDGQARPRRPWTLTAQAFDGLLGALDDDRDRAAAAYERLHERLIGLLRWWGASEPEELADETMDRVARKLESGAVIAEGSLGAYIRGVGRMVFYEWSRRPRVDHAATEVAASNAGSDDHAALSRLDGCLALLTPSERRLVLAYYADGRAAEIRRTLAAELGLSPTALRIKAHRLRARLEAAMKRSAAFAHPLQGDGE